MFIIVIIFYFKRLLGYYVLCNVTKNNCFDSYNAEIHCSRRKGGGRRRETNLLNSRTENIIIVFSIYILPFLTTSFFVNRICLWTHKKRVTLSISSIRFMAFKLKNAKKKINEYPSTVCILYRMMMDDIN